MTRETKLGSLKNSIGQSEDTDISEIFREIGGAELDWKVCGDTEVETESTVVLGYEDGGPAETVVAIEHGENIKK